MPAKATYRRGGLFRTVQGSSPLWQGKHSGGSLGQMITFSPQSGSTDAGVYGTAHIQQAGSFLLRQPNLETLHTHV